MGTDCGIAILKEGEFKTVSLDRYYIFSDEHERITWMSEREFLALIELSKKDTELDWQGSERRQVYILHWLSEAEKIVKQNPGAKFAIYTEHDDDYDKIEIYK